MTQLTDSLKSLYIKTAQKLKGSERRQFMAEVVKGLGIGGQSLAERHSLLEPLLVIPQSVQTRFQYFLVPLLPGESVIRYREQQQFAHRREEHLFAEGGLTTQANR